MVDTYSLMAYRQTDTQIPFLQTQMVRSHAVKPHLYTCSPREKYGPLRSLCASCSRAAMPLWGPHGVRRRHACTLSLHTTSDGSEATNQASPAHCIQYASHLAINGHAWLRESMHCGVGSAAASAGRHQAASLTMSGVSARVVQIPMLAGSKARDATQWSELTMAQLPAPCQERSLATSPCV